MVIQHGKRYKMGILSARTTTDWETYVQPKVVEYLNTQSIRTQKQKTTRSTSETKRKKISWSQDRFGRQSDQSQTARQQENYNTVTGGSDKVLQ
jgi:hypothetical protein